MTRYLGRRRPFSLEMEREWIDRVARSEADEILTEVLREDWLAANPDTPL